MLNTRNIEAEIYVDRRDEIILLVVALLTPLVALPGLLGL